MLVISSYRKRAELEGRKCSFPSSGKAMSSQHPSDPVELRRINFPTPGNTHLLPNWLKRTGTWKLTLGTQTVSKLSKLCSFLSRFAFLWLSSFTKLVVLVNFYIDLLTSI